MNGLDVIAENLRGMRADISKLNATTDCVFSASASDVDAFIRKASLEQIKRVALELAKRLEVLDEDDDTGNVQEAAFFAHDIANNVQAAIDATDDDDAIQICSACNGSGEGMYEGSNCWVCHGSGERK